jgi:hypothetical protein
MARLLNNAWVYGVSNSDFNRDTGTGVTEITPIISYQSDHNAFSISGNAIVWSQQGKYYINMHTRGFDGDDNEAGYGQFLINVGTTANPTADQSNLGLGPPLWNHMNVVSGVYGNKFPDKPINITGQWTGINADAASTTVHIRYTTSTVSNASHTTNPFFYWSINHH